MICPIALSRMACSVRRCCSEAERAEPVAQLSLGDLVSCLEPTDAGVDRVCSYSTFCNLFRLCALARIPGGSLGVRPSFPITNAPKIDMQMRTIGSKSPPKNIVEKKKDNIQIAVLVTPQLRGRVGNGNAQSKLYLHYK